MTKLSLPTLGSYPRIDALTLDCLSLASSPEDSCLIHDRLRGFFRDMRQRLNQLKTGLYVARNSKAHPTVEQWDALDATYLRVEELIDRVERICRPLELTPLACDLDLMISDRRRAWEIAITNAQGAVVWDAPAGSVVGRFDPVRMMTALDAFVEWRTAEFPAGSSVRVAWRMLDDAIQFEWEERWDSLPEVLDGSHDEISLALPVLVSVVAAHGGRAKIHAEQRLLVEFELPVSCPVP